ncbi:MAG: alpha/beta hydrolase [Flavobacteriales bacterium]|nr:alpha/beta hydrolase [Flavobacteriales bacterium]
MEKQFYWRQSVINYQEFGNGVETLICFHGYGQDSTVFNVLQPSLGKRYRMISIDLPYQGKTQWNETEKLSPELLGNLMQSFLLEIGSSARLSLLGYSIGGNYALGFAVAFPQKINAVWLIAADGLKPKPAFNFITKTNIGRWLFKSFVLFPGWMLATVKFAGKIGMIKTKAMKFYLSTIDTKAKREKLFLRWSSTARIAPGSKKSLDSLLRNKIRTIMIYGKNDSVISYRYAQKFHQVLPNSVLCLINKGHKLLDAETDKLIARILMENYRK